MRSTTRNFWLNLKIPTGLIPSLYRKSLFSATLLPLLLTSSSLLVFASIDHSVNSQNPSKLSWSNVWQDLYLRPFDNPLAPLKTQKAQSSLVEIFDRFHSTLDTLQKVEWSDSATQSQLVKIGESLNELEKWSKEWPSKGISQTYVDALSLDAELLSSVKKRESKATLQTVNEVRVDLELKLNYAKASKGTSPALIELVVSTFRAQIEVSDYEVWYVPRGWAEVADKYRRFDDLSSPAIKDLSPGNYLIWLQRDGKSVTGRTPVTLGDDGKSKRRVQLAVSQ